MNEIIIKIKAIKEYIDNVHNTYQSKKATEHSYRGYLQTLIENIVTDINATNEPKRTFCGAPDYVLLKNDIPVAYIEAKNIGDEDLDGLNKNEEQFNRYKNSLNKIIFTDYLTFDFYQDKERIKSIRIAEVTNKGIKYKEDNFEVFIKTIEDFCWNIGQTIKSSKELATIMALKASLLYEVMKNALIEDKNNNKDDKQSSLQKQMEAFKKYLIHDINEDSFADMYAQTITYGIFTAGYHNTTPLYFRRELIATLIPKSNPFLRNFFSYISGINLDERIEWIVDDIVLLLKSSSLQEMLKKYGKSTQTENPIVHFYEDFLREYNPQVRKNRGVWYTPKPVVNFIVRSVDTILKTEFDIKEGLADSSKISMDIAKKNKEGNNLKDKENKIITEIKEIHKVQILDPATGTGTFLIETIKQIYNRFKNQQGIWSHYVEGNLLPRVHGFEILMTSYAMAHLQLSLLLEETNYKPRTKNRFSIYLTNTLEESIPTERDFAFAEWLTDEAKEANTIKKDTPVMCILGNPPYSGESYNQNDFIAKLMEDYKKEPGGLDKLDERNSKWINDDYVKFIRYAQSLIEKNKIGIVAFINPHGYLDNPTFRGMRWNLLKTYDKIYTIDLHGNTKKKETTPDGDKDENVFNIEQGVSINFFIKTGKKKENELGQVFHLDLFGKRQFKYDILNNYSIVYNHDNDFFCLLDNHLKERLEHETIEKNKEFYKSISKLKFTKLPNIAPYYFFIPKNFMNKDGYDEGFSISDLFPINSVGIVTAHDEFSIKKNKESLLDFYKKFQSAQRNVDFLHKEFMVNKKDGWDILKGYDNIKQEKNLNLFIQPIAYRPFDNRYIFYEDKLVWRTVKKIMQHFLLGENIGLSLCKQFKTGNDYLHCFISKKIIESSYVSNKTSEITSLFPLYLYPSEDTIDEALAEKGISLKREPNLNNEIIKEISNRIGYTFTKEKEDTPNTYSPIDILDYCYAVLYSPIYRKKYKEFLKIDFPKVPYPQDTNTFLKLVKLGYQIRKLHLLESEIITNFSTQYPIEGNNIIDEIKYIKIDEEDTLGKVYINKTQYFLNVPKVAWEFYIGGYQPAQKWLKDRKENELSYDDILHYQKIIVALSETHKIIKEIDSIDIGL